MTISIFNTLEDVTAGAALVPEEFKYRLVFEPTKKQKKNTKSSTGGTLVSGVDIGKEANMGGEALRYSKADRYSVFYVGHPWAYEKRLANGSWQMRSFTDMMEHTIVSLIREIADLGVKEYEDIDDVSIAKYIFQDKKRVLHPDCACLDQVYDVAYYANTPYTYINGISYPLKPASVRPQEVFQEGRITRVEIFFNKVLKEVTYVDEVKFGDTLVTKARMDLENTAINVVYGQPDCLELDAGDAVATILDPKDIMRKRFTQSRMVFGRSTSRRSRPMNPPETIETPQSVSEDLSNLDDILADMV